MGTDGADRIECNPAHLSSFQIGYTNSIVSKGDTYLLQQHALFKLWWCMQHLACEGAEVLKTAKQAWLFDLWIHLLQFWLSWHSLNLFPHSASGWLHIAHCWFHEL